MLWKRSNLALSPRYKSVTQKGTVTTNVFERVGTNVNTYRLPTTINNTDPEERVINERQCGPLMDANYYEDNPLGLHAASQPAHGTCLSRCYSNPVPPGFTETNYIYYHVNYCVLGYPEVQSSGQVPTGLPLSLYLPTLVMDCLRIKNASLIFFVTD